MRARRCFRYVIALFAVGMIILVSAQAVRNVQASPSVSFDPSSGIPGTLVTVTLSGYDSSDTSCTVSGTPVYNPSSCSLSGGSGTFTFTIKQYTAAGAYIITITGKSKGDSVQASFQVNGLSFSLNPTSGSVGNDVSFNISNVPTNDTSCSISSPTGNVVTLSACVVSNGSGSGTFIVGNVPPGDYVIEVTACIGNNGCSPSAGDFAQQVFLVTGGPLITISPATGVPGTDISVGGTGFQLSDQACSITSPNPNVVTNSGCSVTAGTQGIHGSFVVGNVGPGQYVIEVTGCSGNNPCAESQGDFAQQVLTVTAAFTPTIVLNTYSVIPGTTIQVSGSGFSTSDTSCSLSGSAVNSVTCSISGGKLSGSFVAGNVATGYYTVSAIGSTGDSASATFGVGPSNAPAIPGFPIEGLLSGLVLGLVIVAIFRRRLLNNSSTTE